MPDASNNRDLFATINAWVRENYPGHRAAAVTLKLDAGGSPVKVKLPIPMIARKPDRSSRSSSRFVPTKYQQAILDALDGRAMRTGELADELGGDRRRLFKASGGIQELKAHGLVENNPRLGYYRPDSPPPEIARDEFIPNPVQEAILEVLAGGQAMRTAELSAATGYPDSQLFRKPRGGMQELRDHGLVEHDARRGYYRPDDGAGGPGGEADGDDDDND